MFNKQKPLPEIDITNPSTGNIAFRGVKKIDLSTSEKEYNLGFNVSDNGGGINEIRVFQNGKLIHSNREKINEKGKVIHKTYKLNLLQGMNNIKVVALNNDRIEKQESCIIEYTGNVQEPANLYVLTIGLNKYKKSTYDLNYAVADANAFAEALEKGSKGIFAKTEIINLRNENATSIKIIEAVKKIQLKSKQSDVFIFYYAGHGAMSVASGNKKSTYYLIPHDITNIYNNEMLRSKGISSHQLQEFSKNISAQKQLFLLDACQSGGMVEMLASRGAVEEKTMAILARSTGTHWLTASGSEQLAGEFGALGHGIFTYVVLQGLSGQADNRKDNKVSVKELSLFVESEVPRLSEKYKGKAQFPISSTFGQDFPVVLSGKYAMKTVSDPVNIEAKPQGKYAKYSIEQLKTMKSEAVDSENYLKANEIKKEIDKRK